MLILALDTALAACSVCLYESATRTVLSADFQAMARGQAEALAPMVKKVMAEADLPLSTVQQILVTVGPGSFTGVRIGLAFARGLGLALGCKVVGIDSLSALAANMKNTGQPFLVAVDALNDEVYCASFTAAGALISGPALRAVADVVADLKADPLMMLGSAAPSLCAAAGLPLSWYSPVGDLIRADNFVAQWASLLQREAAPLYLRQPDIKTLAIPQNIISILPAGVEAAKLLALLHGESFARGWSAEEFARLLHAKGSTALMIHKDHEPIGFVMAQCVAGEAEVLTLAIRPKQRRMGFGQTLLQALFKHLASSGVKAVLLEVDTTNHAALQLYQAAGFTPVGLRKNYYQQADGSMRDARILRHDLHDEPT